MCLDLAGHITYVNTAAGLLGKAPEQLLGTQPSQPLSRLDNTTYMDAYRTALSSREEVAREQRS
ncbi:PAS domain-containing protein [Streptomyces sp. NPDC053069]|uniref:PAS domain-containing protein n=1 Tax=Streptomyces sp. NPDC053069 TaxID=3365695 RepID=UPI0037D6CA9F